MVRRWSLLLAVLVGAAGPFPVPQQGLSLDAAPGLDLRALPPTGSAEEITVFGLRRAPTQRDPHAAVPRFADVPQELQAASVWEPHYGAVPHQSAYETDIGGQPGRP